jgi:putative transposase
VTERVLRSFELAQDGRGRRAYLAWLEVRAANEGGKIDDAAVAAIRRGWYLGSESFKDRLLKLFDPESGKAPSGRSRTGREIRDHGEKEAERLVRAGIRALGAPSAKKALATWPKSDRRKILLAGILRTHTSVSNDWIANRLVMGHPGSISRMLSACRGDRGLAKESDERAEILFPASELTS